MAGLNYFLTHENRNSQGKGLLGEKKDVKAWLGWLELFAHGDVSGVTTPIGILPKYADLKPLFEGIGKGYPKALYDLQFALYVDKIIARIDMQYASYSKETDIPQIIFDIYTRQKAELTLLKERFGSVVAIDSLA